MGECKSEGEKYYMAGFRICLVENMNLFKCVIRWWNFERFWVLSVFSAECPFYFQPITTSPGSDIKSVDFVTLFVKRRVIRIESSCIFISFFHIVVVQNELVLNPRIVPDRFQFALAGSVPDRSAENILNIVSQREPSYAIDRPSSFASDDYISYDMTTSTVTVHIVDATWFLDNLLPHNPEKLIPSLLFVLKQST